MAIDRPKILSVVTVPTGGWTMTLYVDNAGSYDEKIQFTIAAGDYFVAFDHQDDDFIEAWVEGAFVALQTATSSTYNAATRKGKPILTLRNDGKVALDVSWTGADMEFAWDEDDGPSIAGVLGFDSDASDFHTGTQLISDHQHAYGWYAIEDGQLAHLGIEDEEETVTEQARSLNGEVKTHYIASHYRNRLMLTHLTAAQTYSRETAYTGAPPHPYQPNAGFECLWREISEGKRFRVYRDAYPHLDAGADDISEGHEETGTGTDPWPTSTTWEDTSRAWVTSPSEHTNKILAHHFPTDVSGATKVVVRRFINSHTATVLTLANDICNATAASGGDEYYWIMDHRYRTYVLDIGAAASFAPMELPKIGRYEISIAMLRYQA